MNNKKFIVFIITAIIFIAGSALFYFKDALFSKDANASTNIDSKSNDEVHIPHEFIFTGDQGYLIKGKLLKSTFEKEYNALPDTLYSLEFEDKIFLLNWRDGRKKTYSLVEENTLDNLNNYQGTWEQKKFVDYLKLASQGAVEFPTYSGPMHIDYSLTPTNEFRRKYQDYFITTVDNYGISKLPYDVKNKIIDFYQSKEGSNYRYKLKGKQTSADLMWQGELTGKNKNEIAILLNSTENSLDDKYILLVYACKSNPSDSYQEYYLVYNETFYNRVLLDRLKTSGDGEEYVRDIYMNSSDMKRTEFDGIVIKQFNDVDEVLVYSKTYDKLIKYRQTPLSEVNKEEDEE